MAKRIKDGIEITWKNGTSANVTAGTVVVAGLMCGVAAEDIADGESGKIFISGVYEEDKKTATDPIAQGDVLVEDTGIKKISAGTTLVDAVVVGRAAEASNSATTTVKFKLGL